MALPLAGAKKKSDVLQRIRARCLERHGKNSIRLLARTFRIFDDDNNLRLDADEFRSGLADYGIRLSDEDFEEAIEIFDTNKDGSVDVTEFLVAVRGKLNPRRQVVVDAAFKRFDRDGSGVITCQDIAESYDVSRHPDVLSGRKTRADALLQFLCQFDDQSNPDGQVTKQEFDNYYAGVSASIDNDQHFELLLIRAWNLDKPVQQRKRVDYVEPQTIEDVPGANRKTHALYQTSSSSVGKNLAEAFKVPSAHNKKGSFTKTYFGPPRASGLSTAMTKSSVGKNPAFGHPETNPLL